MRAAHTLSHITVVANPNARHGAARRIADEVGHLLSAERISSSAITTADPAEAADLIGKAARTGTDGLVVIGGDGSFRLAVEATIGTRTPVGLIPAGTGNDIARNLGIPLDDVRGALDIIRAGHRRVIDLGRVSFPDGRSALFATVAATGFDAAVTDRAVKMAWPKGSSRYTIAAARELIDLTSRHYQIRVDDIDCERDVVFAAIANTTSYGGGMQIAPHALVDDGLLEVTIGIHPEQWARTTVASVFPKVFSGKHLDHPMVQTMRGREIELYCDPPALVSVDGDVIGELPAVFEVIPDAVEVFAPAA